MTREAHICPYCGSEHLRFYDTVRVQIGWDAIKEQPEIDGDFDMLTCDDCNHDFVATGRT